MFQDLHEENIYQANVKYLIEINRFKNRIDCFKVFGAKSFGKNFGLKFNILGKNEFNL